MKQHEYKHYYCTRESCQEQKPTGFWMIPPDSGAWCPLCGQSLDEDVADDK